MIHCIKSLPFVLGIAGVLSLLFLLFPWSLSTQTSSFSLSLDLDHSEGNQSISSLDVFPNRTIPIQIFATDIASASDLSLRFEFDPTQVAYEGFKRSNIVSGTSALTSKDFANIGITLSSNSPTTGLIGTIHFRTIETFSGTDIRLVRARLVRGGQTETVLMDLSVTLLLAKPPSPDFDRSGMVDVSDFLLFVDVFGSQIGRDRYESKYDLDVDGEIGIPDFLLFIDSFGQVVNRAPIFTAESPVFKNTDSYGVKPYVLAFNMPSVDIGAPILAYDRENNKITYSLSGADGGYFDIDPETGQLKSKAGVFYDFDTRPVYKPIVVAKDAFDATAELEVTVALLPSDVSSTYRDFIRQKVNRENTTLPDFSYAGYKAFNEPVPDITGPVFDVTSYGAVPNDKHSDQDAIVSAIEDASASGGGVVFFPPGEFLVNTDADTSETEPGKYKPIYIRSSNIVLRGSGSRAGGTIIKMVNYMPLNNPNQLWTSPQMFYFTSGITAAPVLARVTEDAEIGDTFVSVSNVSAFYPGKTIKLVIYNSDPGVIDEFLHPSLRGTSFFRASRIEREEEHIISDLYQDTNGDVIVLKEPLRTAINAERNWTVRDFPALENVGVEDISFHGGFLETFVHHKNGIHDGGWKIISMERSVNGWMRRLSFFNTSEAIKLKNSASISVYHITMYGRRGHYGINAGERSTGNWVGLSEDLADNFHGIGFSHNACGIVICRFDMTKGRHIDIHKTIPSYTNLYDVVNNGVIVSNGGGGPNPIHMEHLVFWNFKSHYKNNDWTNINFEQSGWLQYMKPTIVGFQSNRPVTFRENQTTYLELNNNQPVKPESLFETQLQLRKGSLPSWYEDMKMEWDVLRNEPKPNGSPVLKGRIANREVIVGENITIDVSDYFQDPEDHPMTYSVVVDDPSVVTASMSGDMLDITLNTGGEAVVDVIADDGNGGRAWQTFTVKEPDFQ